jgi:YD repeat-containing protein
MAQFHSRMQPIRTQRRHLQRRVSSRLCGNRLREEVRDANANIAQVTQRTVNTLNRIASISGSAGNTTQYRFDAKGQLVAQTDAQNHTTAQTLDALGRPTSTTLADNSTTSLAWNALNQLTSVADPRAITTTYSRNAWGEVLSETSPDSGTTTLVRNAAGQITASTDARGQSTQIQRDALGRPTTVTLADGKKQEFSYDAAGYLSQMTDASGATSYTRDLLGRTLTKTQTVADNPGLLSTNSSYTVKYQYHSGGQVAQLSYPSGLNVYYRKAANGQVSQIDVQEPGTLRAPKPILPWVTNLAYTALGQPKSWNWSNADSASRSFDTDGRMVATEFSAYAYDSAGRITTVTQKLWALNETTNTYFTAPISWSATYDARDRLSSFARAGASTAYTYDANSNRLSAQDTTTSDTDLDGDFDAADYQKTTAQALMGNPPDKPNAREVELSIK